MNREQAIEKIKKCLALGASSNAMKQTKALMEKYGVTMDEAEYSANVNFFHD